MSQQINLLRPKGRSISTAIWPLTGLAVMLLVLVGYRQVLVSENNRLREAATASEQKIRQVKNAVLALQTQQAARNDAAALNAEIASLRPRAEAVSQIMKEINSGSLGSPEGFARFFRTVAGLSEDGLWVTSVSVVSVIKGGNTVTVSGRALRNESVMQYARRLNESFSPYGVRFNSLELTPEGITTGPATSAPAAPVLKTVAFKLS